MQATGPGATEQRPTRGRTLRRVLFAVPWLAAATIAAVGLTTAPATGGTTAPVAEPPPGAVASAEHATPAPVATSPAQPPSLAPELRLAVLATAREALGTAGLPGGSGDAARRWPVEIVVDEVRPVADGFAVVTVHALVIEHEDGWSAPLPRAVGVMVRTGTTPTVLGAAWAVPPPDLPRDTVAGAPVADVDAAVVDPLLAAGWVIDEVLATELVDGVLLRMTVIGTAPGGVTAGRHELWLLDAPGGPRLLTEDS